MTEPSTSENTMVLGVRRQVLEGKIIRACPHCQAPGVYSDHISIQMGWPKCFDLTRVQQPVGDTCPQCGKSRLPDKELGELQASLPLWMWKMILFLKKVYIKLKR